MFRRIIRPTRPPIVAREESVMWTRSDSIEVGLCSKIRIIFSRYTSCLSNKDTHTRHSLYDNIICLIRQSGLKAVSRRASSALPLRKLPTK